ncbi:MAG TPA: hypothetical protein GX691_01125 [Clostridia bacterium]|nr:hypothetical protein [Clostridia bacterium]
MQLSEKELLMVSECLLGHMSTIEKFRSYSQACTDPEVKQLLDSHVRKMDRHRQELMNMVQTSAVTGTTGYTPFSQAYQYGGSQYGSQPGSTISQGGIGSEHGVVTSPGQYGTQQFSQGQYGTQSQYRPGQYGTQSQYGIGQQYGAGAQSQYGTQYGVGSQSQYGTQKQNVGTQNQYGVGSQSQYGTQYGAGTQSQYSQGSIGSEHGVVASPSQSQQSQQSQQYNVGSQSQYQQKY